MEYQVNVNFKFFANSLLEAEKKARMYVEENLNVKPLVNTICSPLDIAERCRDFRRSEKEYFVVFVGVGASNIVERILYAVVGIGRLRDRTLVRPGLQLRFGNGHLGVFLAKGRSNEHRAQLHFKITKRVRATLPKNIELL